MYLIQGKWKRGLKTFMNFEELSVRLIVQKITCTLIVGEVISFDLIRGPGLGQNSMDKGNLAKRIIGYISNMFKRKIACDIKQL